MQNKIDILKDLIQDTINDEYLILSSFYNPINSGDNVDRYLEMMRDIIYEANDLEKNAWGILSQTNDGSVSYLGGKYTYDFDFALEVQTLIELKDEYIEKIQSAIELLISKNNSYNDASILLGFSNLNVLMPETLNDGELVTITIQGTCCITYSNILTSKDLVDVNMSIPSLNIPETKMDITTNMSNFSISPENVQFRDNGYYTTMWTYKCGVQSEYSFLCDFDNPICFQIFKMIKYKIDNPNFELIIKEKINKYTITTKHIIMSIDMDMQENGVIQLSIKTKLNDVVSFDGE